MLLVPFVGVSLLGACSNAFNACEEAVSVPTFVLRFAQGLDNFGEDSYETLRIDTLRTKATLEMALSSNPGNSAAQRLLDDVDDFVAAMDDSLWDVSLALGDERALLSAETFGSAATLALANEVDALVIAECGLPLVLEPNSEPPATLPMPDSPGVNDPDIDADLVDTESEQYALGLVVGTSFGLTLSQEEVMCLGGRLTEVVDRSDATSNRTQYLSQFQIAFDECDIDFQVPTD